MELHDTLYSGGHFMRVDHAWVDLSRIFYKKFYMHDARPYSCTAEFSECAMPYSCRISA
eukprot:COSAG05_NODE_17_length_35518_cov_34.728084_24_plen_59_part_00